MVIPASTLPHPVLGRSPLLAATDLAIEGMTCAGCAGRVEAALRAVPGVVEASVTLAPERARVRAPAGAVDQAALGRAVEQAGYRALPIAAPGREVRRRDGARRDLRHVVLAALLTAPLVLPMLLRPVGLDATLPGWLQLLLATPVPLWLRAGLYFAGWRAAPARRGNP